MWTSWISDAKALPRHTLGTLGALACAALVTLSGCASTATPPAMPLTAPGQWQQTLQQWAGTPLILLGEQHDQSAHHAWEAETVRHLATEGRLAAVVVEMAPAGGSTQGLPASASEAEVKAALLWEQGGAPGGWPWQDYGPVVMNAVRAGVPVLGGNLPRTQMKQAMAEARYDSHLSAAGWQEQLNAIKDGHCGLLPESQFAPMARIQLARDESMAKVLTQAAQAASPGQSVLLVAGRGHSRADIGVPTWLPKNFKPKTAIARAEYTQAALHFAADWWQVLPATASEDQCAKLREQWQKRAAPAGGKPAQP
ncbi:MAG: ChaN family lipoprotein [Comamonas sp.]